MDEKLKQEIKAMVDSFFSEKEEADVRQKTEEALQRSAESINELTVALEDKTSEVDELASKIEELEAKNAELTTELEAAQSEKASADEKLTEALTSIEEMKKDKAAEVRMAELDAEGVAGDKAALEAKVREMTDEEFASYKEERVELRKAVLAELEAAKENETGTESAEEEVPEEPATEQAAEEVAEEEVETPPADVNSQHAVSAALNFETVPSKDVMARYAEMGKAMAESMVGKKDK